MPVSAPMPSLERLCPRPGSYGSQTYPASPWLRPAHTAYAIPSSVTCDDVDSSLAHIGQKGIMHQVLRSTRSCVSRWDTPPRSVRGEPCGLGVRPRRWRLLCPLGRPSPPRHMARSRSRVRVVVAATRNSLSVPAPAALITIATPSAVDEPNSGSS